MRRLSARALRQIKCRCAGEAETAIVEHRRRLSPARRYRTILVPLDGSPTGYRGLRQAIALAKAGRSRLVLLHVADETAAYVDFESGASADLARGLVREGRRILKRAQSLAARDGKSARILLRESIGEPVADEIVRLAKRLHCDLIVMGTHARRRGARRAAGSRGARVARDSPVPVLLVPQRRLTRH
jgi:nucleotide-binding universal stress UspA family protein